MIKRIFQFHGLKNLSCFLWGPRQVGKSTLLKQLFPDRPCFNLLDPLLFTQFTHSPHALRERLLAIEIGKGPMIIDEVQKIPSLLDVIQLLMDNHGMQFILSGSSARKLRRGSGNLLGGRALRYELHPLTFSEIPNFNLLRALNHGLLPRHYLEDDPREMIYAYVADYLKEEIFAEALVRNQQIFSQFLEKAAFSNSQIVNYTNIASECRVKSVTVKEYFQILEDTLIGQYVPSFCLRPKRRVIKAPKFYFFDVGLANFLSHQGQILLGGEAFGRAFEHFIFMELSAYAHYSRLHYPISYWRTSSDLEVDFVLGEAEVVIEVKGTQNVLSRHLKGIKAFREEYPFKKAIVVSLEEAPRHLEGIDILPWALFLENLWSGKYIR
ncbi:MAG: ATP-binding protein [Chlamydiae bacterium]|nr:ATP-binding protein [Chlamydiota bacterium]MBI3266754.1 ATP-binding protein [Chlamydiota bacterium]